MKPLAIVAIILFGLTAFSQAPPPPMFHGLKMGVSLGSQVPECKVQPSGILVEGDPTERCFYQKDDFYSSGMEDVELLVGGQIYKTPDGMPPDPPNAWVSVHLPEGSPVGDGTIESVQLDFPAWQEKDTLDGLKRKYGPPTSCSKTSKSNAVGIPIPQTSCNWKLSWGLLHFENNNQTESQMEYVLVRATTNRALKLIEDARQKREKKASDQF